MGAVCPGQRYRRLNYASSMPHAGRAGWLDGAAQKLGQEGLDARPISSLMTLTWATALPAGSGSSQSR